MKKFLTGKQDENKQKCINLYLALNTDAVRDTKSVVLHEGLRVDVKAYTTDAAPVIATFTAEEIQNLKDPEYIPPRLSKTDRIVFTREMKDGRIVMFIVDDMKKVMQLAGTDGASSSSISWSNVNHIACDYIVIKNAKSLAEMV